MYNVFLSIATCKDSNNKKNCQKRYYLTFVKATVKFILLKPLLNMLRLVLNVISRKKNGKKLLYFVQNHVFDIQYFGLR